MIDAFIMIDAFVMIEIPRVIAIGSRLTNRNNSPIIINMIIESLIIKLPVFNFCGLPLGKPLSISDAMVRFTLVNFL